MHQVAKPETFPRPEFRIDGTAKPETVELLNQAVAIFEEEPGFAMRALALAYRATSAGEFIKVFDEHGETGIKKLKTINDLWTSGADKELSYDEATESAIFDSDEFQELKGKKDSDDRTSQIRYTFLSMALARSAVYQQRVKNQTQVSA